MAMSEPLFKPESLRNLAKDNGPEYAGRSRRALRWCADVIEAADAVVQESNQVRKDDESLIRQVLEHLEVVNDAGPDGEGWQSQDLKNTIAAARARLEKAP